MGMQSKHTGLSAWFGIAIIDVGEGRVQAVKVLQNMQGARRSIYSSLSKSEGSCLIARSIVVLLASNLLRCNLARYCSAR